jgi:hypothetical protein
MKQLDTQFTRSAVEVVIRVLVLIVGDEDEESLGCHMTLLRDRLAAGGTPPVPFEVRRFGCHGVMIACDKPHRNRG